MTMDNISEYLELTARTILIRTVRSQVSAFREGFDSVRTNAVRLCGVGVQRGTAAVLQAGGD